MHSPLFVSATCGVYFFLFTIAYANQIDEVSESLFSGQINSKNLVRVVRGKFPSSRNNLNIYEQFQGEDQEIFFHRNLSGSLFTKSGKRGKSKSRNSSDFSYRALSGSLLFKKGKQSKSKSKGKGNAYSKGSISYQYGENRQMVRAVRGNFPSRRYRDFFDQFAAEDQQRSLSGSLLFSKGKSKSKNKGKGKAYIKDSMSHRYGE